MRSRTLTCFIAMTLFAVLALPARLSAQGQKKAPPHYTVTDLRTLGGTFAAANGVNNRGWVDGFSTLPGDMQGHAFLFRNGEMRDLGTLGGLNSFAGFPLNERGEVTGGAETSTPDPLGEDFCGFDTHLVCLPFIWQNGMMTPLPVLGGNNGNANEINNRGQVVGIAENATPDPTCVAPQVLHFKPVIWEKGEIQELPTIAGDPDGVANAINDRGQAVGCSRAFGFDRFCARPLLRPEQGDWPIRYGALYCRDGAVGFRGTGKRRRLHRWQPWSYRRLSSL